MRSRRISSRVLAPGRGYNIGGEASHHLPVEDMYLLREGLGRGRWRPLRLRPRYPSCRSDHHSDFSASLLSWVFICTPFHPIYPKCCKMQRYRTFCGSATHQMAPPIDYWSTDALICACTKKFQFDKK
ncbi:hypothetical protein AVEN_198674-1 [Araneus ventricosus]|uniref:Uncharacterized protein n=1 Tax=Araneus ventricosus TaxID=182803 RepID=A0A4Y2W139_ARAVE|nr:hypothetical protein AVEN_198674-1 [Araneus ventricosus]